MRCDVPGCRHKAMREVMVGKPKSPFTVKWGLCWSCLKDTSKTCTTKVIGALA